MSEPFLAEIRIVGFSFPPRGWALCDGQLLPINQNQSLFSLLGTIYGGDGRTTFALPDLRGRAPVHVASDHPQGQQSGEEGHTLTAAEMPAHDHEVFASSDTASTPIPAADKVLADSAPSESYHATSSTVSMRAGTIAAMGGDQAHENMQPWLALNFCIALQGTYPSRN